MSPSRRGNGNHFCRSLRQDGLAERLRRCRDLRQIDGAATGGCHDARVRRAAPEAFVEDLLRHGFLTPDGPANVVPFPGGGG